MQESLSIYKFIKVLVIIWISIVALSLIVGQASFLLLPIGILLAIPSLVAGLYGLGKGMTLFYSQPIARLYASKLLVFSIVILAPVGYLVVEVIKVRQG